MAKTKYTKAELKKFEGDVDKLLNMDALVFLETINDSRDLIAECSTAWLKKCQSIRKKYPILDVDYKKSNLYVNSYFFINQLINLWVYN